MESVFAVLRQNIIANAKQSAALMGMEAGVRANDMAQRGQRNMDKLWALALPIRGELRKLRRDVLGFLTLDDVSLANLYRNRIVEQEDLWLIAWAEVIPPETTQS